MRGQGGRAAAAAEARVVFVAMIARSPGWKGLSPSHVRGKPSVAPSPVRTRAPAINRS